MAQLPAKTGAGSLLDAATTVSQQQSNFGNWLQFLIDLFGTSDSATSKVTALDTALGISGSIAAAATTDLSTLTMARQITLTNSGTVAISSFGTVTAGAEREVVVSNTGTLTLTASANLTVPGTASGNSVTLYNGDCLRLVSLGSGAWRVRSIDRANWTTDQMLSFRNKIRNGRMDIAQRGASIASMGNGNYSLDGWKRVAAGAQVVTHSQQANANAASDFQSVLRVQVTTANAAPAAGDYEAVIQPIEGYLVRDLVGNPAAIRFEAKSPKAGVHCVSLSNSGSDRSYVLTYNVAAANTAQTFTLPLPGGLITAGTWNWTNGVGLQLRFCLMAGTTFQAAAGAWQTGNFLATSAQVNCMDTVGSVFEVTGVQLERANASTPFEHRDFTVEVAINQRYFEKSYDLSAALGSAVIGGVHQSVASTSYILCAGSARFAVPKRANPGMGFYSPNSGGGGLSAEYNSGGTFVADRGCGLAGSNTAGFEFQISGAATVGNNMRTHWYASSEL